MYMVNGTDVGHVLSVSRIAMQIDIIRCSLPFPALCQIASIFITSNRSNKAGEERKRRASALQDYKVVRDRAPTLVRSCTVLGVPLIDVTPISASPPPPLA